MKNSFVLIALSLSILILGASGCHSKPDADAVLNSHIIIPDSVKYLALGDSYTIGQSVSLSQNFPHQLLDSLKLRGIATKSLETIARTGWTTSELKDAINQSGPANDYDLVTLLIGVNNQFRGYDIDIFTKEFEELLLQSIQFAAKDASHVFVLSIPDYGCTPFGVSRKDQIGKDIDNYNAIALQICTKYKVEFFDITPISRKALTQKNLIAPDSLHPSEIMYSEWVKLISSDIAQKLKH